MAEHGSEFGVELLMFTSDTGIFHRAIPEEAQWHFGMVERHGPVLADIIQANLSETHVSGKAQMQYALTMLYLAKNRRPGRTGHSPISLIYGVEERRLARGLDHYMEQPNGAALTRYDPAHTRSMTHRTLAMKAGLELAHSESWKDAIRYFARPVDTSHEVTREHTFFWTRGLQARLKEAKGPRREFHNARSARTVDRGYGLAVVIGHAYVG